VVDSEIAGKLVEENGKRAPEPGWQRPRSSEGMQDTHERRMMDCALPMEGQKAAIATKGQIWSKGMKSPSRGHIESAVRTKTRMRTAQPTFESIGTDLQ